MGKLVVCLMEDLLEPREAHYISHKTHRGGVQTVRSTAPSLPEDGVMPKLDILRENKSRPFPHSMNASVFLLGSVADP